MSRNSNESDNSSGTPLLVSPKRGGTPPNPAKALLKGAGFGATTSSSLILLYAAICLTQKVWAKDKKNTFTIAEQFNKVAISDLSAVASFGIYIATATVLFGLLNFAVVRRQARAKKNFDPASHNTQDLEANSGGRSDTTDIPETTKAQRNLKIFLHTAFFAANATYCITYWDMGKQAIKNGVLPSFGGLLTWANTLAAITSFAYNLPLNHHYFKELLDSAFPHYNQSKFSKWQLFKKEFLHILLASTAASPFMALAAYDKAFGGKSVVLKYVAITAAYFIYAALNFGGAKGIKKELLSAYTFFANFPTSLRNILPTCCKSSSSAENTPPSPKVSLEDLKHKTVKEMKKIINNDPKTENAGWKNYTRKPREFIFGNLGRLSASFLLLAYGTVVKNEFICKINSLDPNGAPAAFATLLVFYPFMKVVYGASATKMVAFSEKLVSLFKLRSYFKETANLQVAKDFTLLTVQISIFYFALTTAGSALNLLDEMPFMKNHASLHAVGKSAVSITTALFNSGGMCSVVDIAIRKINYYYWFNTTQKTEVDNSSKVYKRLLFDKQKKEEQGEEFDLKSTFNNNHLTSTRPGAF